MAETTEKTKQPKSPKAAPGKREGDAAPGKGKGKDKAPAGAVDHAPKAAEGTPRLQEYYEKTVRAKIQKDFGLPNRSFDGRGNYTFGIKEQMIFPEIDFDKVEKIHGMDITIVTSTDRDDLAMALLRELGWPFRGETPQRVA